MLFMFCCFNTLYIITHYIIEGLFSAFVKFHLPVFTSSFFLCCYHRDAPSLSARRLWLLGSLALTGERHWWASVSLARLRHQCSEKGIYLALTVFPWQPAPHRQRHVDPFCHYGLTAEKCEIQLGEIHSCNWNEFAWETDALWYPLAVNSPCLPACM